MEKQAMTKIRKSFLKRFKITKKGKILRQIAGQSHGFAKRPPDSLRRKKGKVLAPEIVLDYKNSK